MSVLSLSPNDIAAISVSVGQYHIALMKSRESLLPEDETLDDAMASIKAILTYGIGQGIENPGFTSYQIHLIMASIGYQMVSVGNSPDCREKLHSLFERLAMHLMSD